MDGKIDDARKSFQESLEQARRTGMRSGAMEARGALRRLDRAAGVQAGEPMPSAAAGKATKAA